MAQQEESCINAAQNLQGFFMMSCTFDIPKKCCTYTSSVYSMNIGYIMHRIN